MQKSFTSIILCTGHIGDIILPDPFIVMDYDNYFENANSNSLSESKFSGSIGIEIIRRHIVVMPNAARYMTSRRKFFPKSKLASLGIDIKWYLWQTLDDNSDSESRLINLMDIKYEKQITSIQDFDVNSAISDNFILSKYPKITSGYNAKVTFNGVTYDAHCTCDYGLNIANKDDVDLISNKYSYLVGQTINGRVIDMKLDDMPNNGYVVWLYQLNIDGVEYPHLTILTTIRAVLSSQIVSKYANNIMQFKLKEIDPANKNNASVILSSQFGKVDVQITGVYMYIL